MTRRSQMEILIDILEAVAEGKRKPTHIMYRANLSWTRLSRNLDLLVGQNLLKAAATDESSKYEVTERGKEVLAYFRRVESEFTPSADRRIPRPTEVYARRL